jgi:hypothetical protein
VTILNVLILKFENLSQAVLVAGEKKGQVKQIS